MRRAILVFGAIGGLGVPLAFVLLGWVFQMVAPDARAWLRDVEWPLWPMSRMFADDPERRHWLYLLPAAILSNALIYAAIGALSAWGRRFVPAFGGALVAAIAVLVAAQRGFGTSTAGLAIAVAFAVTGLLLHHRSGGRGRVLPAGDAS
jgi:hypothetical protein